MRKYSMVCMFMWVLADGDRLTEFWEKASYWFSSNLVLNIGKISTSFIFRPSHALEITQTFWFWNLCYFEAGKLETLNLYMISFLISKLTNSISFLEKANSGKYRILLLKYDLFQLRRKRSVYEQTPNAFWSKFPFCPKTLIFLLLSKLWEKWVPLLEKK